MNSDEAREFIKREKKKLLSFFVPESVLAPEEDPILICMAGSSGAGKTETATVLMENLFQGSVIRIDADDVKAWLKSECGGDINDYHSAAVLGVEKIYDKCRNDKKNCIIDGTFVDFDKSLQNIENAFKKGFNAIIIYVYQDPELAWKFVKKRELKTGRKVPFEIFETTFINSIQNVVKMKELLKEKVVVFAVRKNLDFSTEEFKLNADLSYLRKIEKDVKMKKV